MLLKYVKPCKFMLIRYLNLMYYICDSRLHNLNLTRYSTISTRYSTILTRYSTNWTRYSTILTWYSTNSTWYSTILTRYSTILTRYSTNSTRYSTILTRYSTNLTRYSTISTRYSTILTRYSTILTWYSTNSTRYSTNLTWYSTNLTRYLQLYKSWHSLQAGAIKMITTAHSEAYDKQKVIIIAYSQVSYTHLSINHFLKSTHLLAVNLKTDIFQGWFVQNKGFAENVTKINSICYLSLVQFLHAISKILF